MATTQTGATREKIELVHVSEANIGISNENVQGVAAILNRVLADEHVLYIKTRNYHWNVTGSLFDTLHKLFQAHYEELAEEIDEIAERLRMIGVPAIGAMSEFLQHTTLSEQTGSAPDAMTMVANLLSDHEAIIRNLRRDLRACDEQYDDMGSSEFLTGLMRKHEKMAWFLRSFLEDHS